MKITVKCSCGHTEQITVFGSNAERERKIKYLETSGVCSTCYKEQKEIEKAIGTEEKEMSYKEYKTNYADCKTKAGSYNGTTKTIVVYVPVNA